MTLREYLTKQQDEILSNENRWYAGEYFKREVVEPDLLCYYYIKVTKSAENFAARHRHLLDKNPPSN